MSVVDRDLVVVEHLQCVVSSGQAFVQNVSTLFVFKRSLGSERQKLLCGERVHLSVHPSLQLYACLSVRDLAQATKLIVRL